VPLDNVLGSLPVLSLAAGLVGGGVVARLTIPIARARGVLDLPGKLKCHNQPTPRLGGVGIVIGMTLGVLLSTSALSGTVAFLVGGLLVALTGLVDDIHGLSPGLKVAGVVVGGLSFLLLSWPGLAPRSLSLTSQLLAFVGLTLTICYLVNSFNLLDGMDGLAAGVAAIAAAFLSVMAYLQASQELLTLAWSLGGACLGFLFLNLPPARTFMGDVGSLFLGFAVSSIAVELNCRLPLSIPRLVGTGLVLAVPIADTLFSIVRRLARRHGVFSGDRLHLYDAIFHRTESVWGTLLAMWGLSAVLGLLGIAASLVSPIVSLAIAAAGGLGLLFLGTSLGSLVLPRARGGLDRFSESTHVREGEG